MGTDGYPTDLTAAYGLLVHYRSPTSGTNHRTPRDNNNGEYTSAMTFAQQGCTPGRNGVTHEDITCFSCQSNRHYVGDCPSTDSRASGISLVQYTIAYVLLAQAEGKHLPKNWILLDTQSTISVFNNPDMLEKIRPSGSVLRALTNGGHQDSTMIRDFPNLGPVWFNRDSIAKILSMADVRKVCRVTMDASNEPSLLLLVHQVDGLVMRFVEQASGLYAYDTNLAEAHGPTNERINDYIIVQTVTKNKKMFTRREVQAADEARTLYQKLGCLSEKQYQQILQKNLVRSCPITPDDAHQARVIYAPISPP
jgi:hypothetical protein